MEKFRYDTCFNPFNIQNHGKKNMKNLRRVLPEMLQKLPTTYTSSNILKVCDACRMKIYKLPMKSESGSSCSDILEEDFFMSKPGCSNLRKDSESSASSSTVNITAINESLAVLHESPIAKRKLVQKNYPIEKRKKVMAIIDKKIFNVVDQREEENLTEHKAGEVVEKLKDLFKNTEDRSLKVKILTIFEDWSYREILEHFDTSYHMIKVSKEIAKQKGVLSSPNPKGGKILNEEIVHKIIEFYESDEVSRLMPGKRDCVSIKAGTETVKVQKRLVLCNLKECFQLFKEKYPQCKVQFSKFAALRPKSCILAGASGTHSVCVCAIHQNVKLMIDGAQLVKLTGNSNLKIKNYQDCLAQITCVPATVNCFLRKCDQCPGCENLVEQLKILFSENMVDLIVYKQWITVDRTSLETMQSSVEDYLEKLSGKLEKLLTHSFIAKEQSNFLSQKKETLQLGECIVLCDFSENYAFVLQDAIQGVHWNNDQVTIHPFAIYFIKGEKLKTLIS